MKNLHSHNVQSVLSQQQEVTAFGQGDGKGDGGDDWYVICHSDYWKRDDMVQLRHKDTGKFLGTASHLVFNQQNLWPQLSDYGPLGSLCARQQ